MITIREYGRSRKEEWVDYRMYVNRKHVGDATVYEFENGTYIERLDIVDIYRNRGYGTKFVSWLANRYGCVYAAPDNKDSKRFFDRMGDDESYGEFGGFDQGFGVYKILSRYVENTDDVKFYVKHFKFKPKQDPNMVKVERISFYFNPLYSGDTYIVYRGTNGRYAFAWNFTAEFLHVDDNLNEKSGYKWYKTKEEAYREVDKIKKKWEEWYIQNKNRFKRT